MLRRDRLRTVTLALLLVCSFASGSEPPKPLARPKLAIVVSIDGLSWERLSGYAPWYTAGLKRLLDEGLVRRETRYRHLNTETGPGHASLGTGAPPRITGIVSNRWFEELDGALDFVYCTDQPAPGRLEGSTETIPGPANLRVPTLGDRLVAAYPGARVVSVSGKDRGSIFLAGKDRSHCVYWYDPETGRMVTSAAYETAKDTGLLVKTIVRKFNLGKASGMLPGRFGLLWKKTTLPLPAVAKLPQPAKGIELHQVPANGILFDHDLSRNQQGYFNGFYISPFLDELTMDLALTLLQDEKLQLGHGTEPDLLCLSLSSQDTVSHNYGAESEENLDVLRRRDVQLGRLFEVIDQEFPKGTVVLALSADHGFTPIPEVEKKKDKAFTGGRLVYSSSAISSYIDRLNRLVEDDLCLDHDGKPPLHGSEGWNITYNWPDFPLRTVEGTCGPAGRPVFAADIDRVLPGILKRHFAEEIKDVLLVSQKDGWPKSDPVIEFVLNDFDAPRSGNAIIIPKPNVLMHWDPGRGSGHGSHYERDIHVPLVFWGFGIKPGASDEPSTPYDLAPTLGRLLGVSLPDAIGRALNVR